MAVVIRSPKKKDVKVDVRSVAFIDPKKCVNCGTCREVCPTEAIREMQRTVCRLCPSCTDHPAMTLDENEKFSSEKACTTECPLGISPQGYINLTRLGQYEDAFELIWKKNPLPSVCGRICHHPCEEGCKRGSLVDEPLAIRGIKRFLSDNVEPRMKRYPVKYSEEIAVIGAGPAGLTAAHELSLKGYRTTVFDEAPEAGGMLIAGIPSFRLPRDVVKKDVGRLAAAGIRFRLGTKVGKSMMHELKNDYDAILVCAGAPTSKELMIEGWRKEGIFTALQFMQNVNAGELLNRHPGQNFKEKDAEVVVIGGGNVALDCARSALRRGAVKVTCTCLESGKDVPCHEWERKEAEEEGIRLLEGWAPREYTGTHNMLSGVSYCKVKNFRKENGKISFDTDETNTMELKADYVIVAIGQSADEIWREYYDDRQVYFAGDVKDPVNSVVDAMASGRKTAELIDWDLRGRKTHEYSAKHEVYPAPPLEKVFPANRLRIDRPPMPITPVSERIHNFNEVETAYSPEVIDLETRRCLQCGYEEVNPDKCIGCEACMRECPKGDAITMVPVDEGGVD
ncbi:MAG: FAD-dependent oxidoreductase [Bilifractor sp.]|jgi:NADPH-dependent glutamate synthase beta subunit-like oxidoreductase